MPISDNYTNNYTSNYANPNAYPRVEQVIKIGGNQLDDPAFLARVGSLIAGMESHGQALPVIVHGGGKQIRALQERQGISANYIDGLRVTDPATMEIVQMVLCGLSNVNIVAALTAAGVEAQGYNGADRGLLRGAFMSSAKGDLGRVGSVAMVRAEILYEALSNRVVPVIAPVLIADDGGYLNCNADKAAGAIAAALHANSVVFLTDVPGVLHDGQPLETITAQATAQLIADGVITGGMAVKLNAALDALSAGVAQARITTLDHAQESGMARGTLVIRG